MWGLFTGLTFGLLQLVLGLRNVSFFTSAASIIAIIFLDYLIAYTVIGFSGVLRGKVKDQGMALTYGVLIGCLLRYICHVIVGATVWAGLSIPTDASLFFSLAYNAAYMVPETLLMLVGAYYIGKAFCLTEQNLKRTPMEETSLVNLYSAIPVSLGAVIAFLRLFAMMQTSDGFDITNVGKADVYSWIALIAIFAVGVLGSLILRATLKSKSN
jgi:thiamine transporter